ncbi:uncharacterized protein BDR25DRAFT_323567 [Lindgomyces ingoldianus]|uniref:Uncharacterized protein n=1 Tax=Lindgomyces ingoldianus TaxID=673940 RepID=A0ACB6R6E7_9PLEO|nr:uncharacterized protein BDR25DRAFT_323567 [Lindgomyces ingoldianus]KAF2473872.1 hypothetical protein BDR25DRAFT_323567 [Lindgomyces ingoldianus]
MSWLMRGIQSAVFHYVSCAPCTGYMYRNKRRKQAKKERKARQRLHLEQPELYHHPEPSGTNPFWTEEITIGPGPPPRRARGKTNATTGSRTESQRAITTAGTHSTVVSQGGSSIDVRQADDPSRLSDDTLDDDNWNRRRYQREDEDLWGFGEPESAVAAMPGSSVGVGGLSRPGTSKSSAESYYTARVPPVNDLHPPVVSLPSPHPSDNRWMLQPPPKASVMSGKERATNRSRSGSGASSRVELSLQRQVSAKQLRHKLERGETPEMPPLSRGSSYSNFQKTIEGQRPRTPQARPPSAASSRKKKRRDTAHTKMTELEPSSGSSSDTIVHGAPIGAVTTPPSSSIPTLKVVRVRTSRQRLSTILAPSENNLPRKSSPGKRTQQPTKYSSTASSDSIPYYTKHRTPLASSDVSSLNVLQDLVSPRALLNSRFVSAPLMEARIKLPPSDTDEEKVLRGERSTVWAGSGFGISRDWATDQIDSDRTRTPFDSLGVPPRDPRMRWSVDF